MTEDQLNEANKLKEQRDNVLRELDVWEKELTNKDKLGYLQGWTDNHAVKLSTCISDKIFEGFRCAAMDNLKLRLQMINMAFNEI